MFENPAQMKIWNFLKFVLVFVIPLILGASILAMIYVFLQSINAIMTFVIAVITLTLFCYFYIKYIYRIIDNDKVMDWIEKPWSEPSISFKK